MAGRNNGTGRVSASNSSSNLRAPPPSANGYNKRRSLTSAYGFGSQSLMDVLSGVSSIGGSTSISRGDKTVCQYCGVSYLTMSEMKALQTTVKEQEERLTHYKTMMEENNRLKEALEAARKDGQKSEDESTKRNQLEREIVDLKKQLRNTKAKNLDLAQKYTIANDDSRQQEELIASLREDLSGLRETQVKNVELEKKVSILEAELEQARFESDTKLKDKSGHKNSAGDNGQGHSHSQQQQEQETELRQTASKTKSTPCQSQESIEVYDLKKLNGYLSDKLRSVTDEHANCQNMHTFLRETVDKLKTDNVALHEDINVLRMKLSSATMELENMEAKCQGISGENERLKQSMEVLDLELTAALEQNRMLSSGHSAGEAETLQQQVSKLEQKVQEQKQEMVQMSSEYEKKLSDQQRETNMEKERADSCLRQMIVERDEVEKRWDDRWNRHQTSLNEQLDSLKSYYEQTVHTAKEIEEGLQRDLKLVKDHFDERRDEWEACKADLNAQIAKLKSTCRETAAELETVQKSKIEIEVYLQNKNEELDQLQEMVREGCEERQELQKKIEQLEEYIEETRRGNLQKRPSLLFQNVRSESDSASPKDPTPRVSFHTGMTAGISDGLNNILANKPGVVNRASTPVPVSNLAGETSTAFTTIKPILKKTAAIIGNGNGSSQKIQESEIGVVPRDKRKQHSVSSPSLVKSHRQRESVSRLSTPKSHKPQGSYVTLARKSK